MTVDELEAEARTLTLPVFDEAVALRLGGILTELARSRGLPIVIDIRSGTRCFYHAALPGSAALNDLWARRKSATALVFQAASFLVGARNRAKGESLTKHGLSEADHADHGGAVPLVVAEAGMVAVATVSGLPQAEDHALVVEGLRLLLAELAGG